MNIFANSNISQLVLVLVMIALFYFVVMLPQKKRETQHKNMINSLKIGDEVITIGGIKGFVSTLADGICDIETSFDRTKIRIETWGIKEVVISEKSNSTTMDKNQEGTQASK